MTIVRHESREQAGKYLQDIIGEGKRGKVAFDVVAGVILVRAASIGVPITCVSGDDALEDKKNCTYLLKLIHR